ncbi:DNA-binding response regulator [Flavobacterium noncentrifugens]|uniref:Two component transcriptional regulator, LytTR family n=1 Tax=Flavobacterium noncentrifugens TaxID=1128970 RepID=A0A1G9AQ51_9FLAO|nr:LytTR family DNA-binding domain-containing protein [Flavobacterium noncentrifugens]GEP51543.1 DNA-binding response regulator [Flavobacterium noncentrifugens]SDK29462.1 two component transcriptional regulator, LytTR family [Flavobacterium noncentrifugens]
MIRAIALDDEPLALKVIESFCARVGYIQLEKTFTKTFEAHKYLRKQPVDLIFLDIQMPMQNGMEFYVEIEQNVMVIFTTAYSEYAVEGFNVNATDYLLKPFSFDRFSQAAEKVKGIYENKNQVSNSEQLYLFIRADYSLNKILISDILFIEGLDDYLKIHIANQKTIVARMTMKAILGKLPASEFVRVHRSFIVPVSKIEKVRNKVIYIGAEEIPLSASYESAFLSIINSK